MRIIAGIAKGRKLLSPEGMETRPTLDRVKESIFSIIQNRTSDAIVLDMFAGTGSLGLEAVSRGAKYCYLVDKGKTSYSLLCKNVINFNFQDKCKTFNADTYEVLKDLAKKDVKFNLIFIDPPYAKEMIPPAIEIISSTKALAEDGLIVSKIDSSETIYPGNDIISLIDSRKYGNTTICMYNYKEGRNE